ncbi:UDP-glycosyltransferase UGT5-like [Oratosquilla oratoria]|uniref:UDP-glycosyltransferase UGT5-like n=1 Tax=Oratosquilla oratoria TaxID=337810 RepID=UPI003F769C64
MWHSFSTLTVLLLHGLFSICLCELPPPDKSYKILMLLPLSSRSHENVFLPLAKALADRGHEVTMIKNSDMNSQHPHIHEIRHNLDYADPSKLNLGEAWGTMDVILKFFDEDFPKLTRDLYKVPKVAQIFKRRQEFDVVIIDHPYNEMALPFAHERPLILLSPGGLESSTSGFLGNVLNPSYTFTHQAFFRNPMTFVERLRNLVAHFIQYTMYNINVLPKIQAEISEQFPDLPSLMDIKKNVSLTLLNSDHTYDTSVPLLPSQVEIGGIQCRPAKPLPKDLSAWIEGSGNEGVIYFSFGSVARGSNIPQKYLDIFVAAFAQIPQRVIWKFENETLPGISENVLLRKWLPQQDILAQEKVKVFITHGGMMSTQEGIYHGTPLLALPIFGDQPRNCDMISAKGYGLCLRWEDFTVDVFVSKLKEIIEDKRYSQRVAATSLVFRDKKDSPVDRAVWWTEYVIRHQGAPSLECPGRHLSWTEFLLIDVIFLLHVVVFVVVWLLLKCKRGVGSILWSASKKKNE